MRLNAVPSAAALNQDTLSAQVARYLLDKIGRENLKPGDVFDSEGQVCRELKVSRGSVREAYRVLAALGILEIGSGRRPRIQAVSSSTLAQIFGHALRTSLATPLDVLELRRGIEVHGAQLAARFATEAQLERLRDLVIQMRAALHNEAARVAADLAIHVTLAEASKNPLHKLVLAGLDTAIARSLRDDHAITRPEVDIVRITDAHEAIVERVCARDPVGAGAAMACHFDLSINSLFRGQQK
jgi:DNA-binding FadR family transcriptional regulator